MENRRGTLLAGSAIVRTLTMAAARGVVSGTGETKRMSVNHLYSKAAAEDVEVDDDLARVQRDLRELKTKISLQSKRNFLLERDVRYLDGRIALLIQNRMNLTEQEVNTGLEEEDPTDGIFPDEKKRNFYGNLFFLLQSEPRHMAHLTRLVTLSEIDTLLQTVMFTLYGNQYESREENLLLTMFQSVLAAQFESATDFGNLLRANTPVSRMMTTYTRRGPGQSYLKNVLAAKINDIIESKPMNLEINPLKVYEQYYQEEERRLGEACTLSRSVTSDEAANCDAVKNIIAPRLVILREIADGFVDTIIENKEQVPYGIRWICKQIRSLTKRKFPTATDFSICSLIGAFFFLRFLNPAIVTPQAYMLIESSLQPNPRRTLTLVAKLLQNLANKPSYSKETYMMSLNSFVDDNKIRINKFLNELCEVGDFFDTLELDQYMALTRKEILLNITLNEIYNTHSLLLQHLDELAPQEDSHLRAVLNDLGFPPQQLSRSDNKSVELHLISRWETTLSDAMASLGDSTLTQSDLLFMEAKSIFVQLVRSMPGLMKVTSSGKPLSASLRLDRIAEAAATSKDPTLVNKGLKVREILVELEDLKVATKADNYQVLAEEVKQELAYLGSLKDKVIHEFQSLQSVYKTICDHNEFLRSQLESYKAYLQNVRLQATGGMKGTIAAKELSSKKVKGLGPFKFTHAQLEKDGVIMESQVPENRQVSIFFQISSPSPGTFVISLHFKGREKAILEMDLKLDDLLEKQQDHVEVLDLEYVQFNVTKLLQLLNKTFNKR